MAIGQTWFRWGPSEFDRRGRRIGGEMPLDPVARGIPRHLTECVRWDFYGEGPPVAEFDEERGAP
ncbi:hypothetical protein [Amycolatopsis sp. H20-H5]|uniref:hypothetical protein n=1 Tax=Amycolatopsis sp. H20-H5 TaxID=3046309 RepID=UPI002DBFC3F9|nr:hypothetical protein [Amycolatopsis sp. H20-H5]MEC3979216.1 hypothetical protein [Amycolatopsis sp. H20-H5]